MLSNTLDRIPYTHRNTRYIHKTDKMSTEDDSKPFIRRSSFSTNMTQHRHTSIPNCASSDPNNPIPCEPKHIINPFADLSPQLRPTRSTTSSTPRNSGGSLGTSSDETTDSDTSTSTPPNESEDMDVLSDKMENLSRSPSSPSRKRRRGSVTYASNTDEIKRILGDGTAGTKLLQKFCCGEGCCMMEALPSPPQEYAGISTPDNDAYRFLNLDVAGLSLDTHLTKIVDLPEQKISFGAIRRQSIAEKFPGEDEHEHDEAAVNIYPPEYMKPHPPYSIFNAPVYGARELTKPGAEKRTFHFDIDVSDYPEEGGVDFKVGGAVGICPPNDPAMVEDIMDQLGMPRFQRDKPIRLFTTEGRWPTIWGR